jgi:hypothetical protein
MRKRGCCAGNVGQKEEGVECGVWIVVLAGRGSGLRVEG